MLWLIGMMGAGKSSVGATVARQLGVPLKDTDELVADSIGLAISEIFEFLGERAFREAEEAVVADVALGTPAVVATGGGVVLSPRNIETMRDSGVVVWLQATPGELAARTGSGAGRPLLGDQAGSEHIAALLADRTDRYENAAHHSVDTEGRSIEAVAMEVAALWSVS